MNGFILLGLAALALWLLPLDKLNLADLFKKKQDGKPDASPAIDDTPVVVDCGKECVASHLSQLQYYFATLRGDERTKAFEASDEIRGILEKHWADTGNKTTTAG
mgnify:CR=1 FL=1